MTGIEVDRLILDFLTKSGPHTQAQLCLIFNLATSVVSMSMRRLRDSKAISEFKRVRSPMGGNVHSWQWQAVTQEQKEQIAKQQEEFDNPWMREARERIFDHDKRKRANGFYESSV